MHIRVLGQASISMSASWWISDTDAPDRPHAARIYAYLLGGYHNFEIDRKAAEYVLQICAGSRLSA